MWVDGAPRVACVTPVRRVVGREVTTVDGLPDELRQRWVEAFVDAGASQCGFCTPGILLRLAALERRGRAGRPVDEAAIRTALLAHLCRCTGWQTIVEAAAAVLDVPVGPAPARPLAPAAPPPAVADRTRDPLLAAWRAQLEGPAYQTSSPDTVLGRAGFADDTAPAGAWVALPSGDDWTVAPSLAEARARAPKVQGRNSSVPLRHPVPLPDGDWAVCLRTTWVEPAYLEPDASWCAPAGRPATPLANGGAFGGKRRSPVPAAARVLADRTGHVVRARWDREEVVRRGPKRPPVALGLRADGTGILRVGRTPGSAPLDGYAERVAAAAPALVVEEVEVPGPPVAADLRLAGWLEATAALAALRTRPAGGAPVEVAAPSGGRARVAIAPSGEVAVDVWAGEVLDEATLRSYCIGAVHQALGWVRSEGIAVDAEGVVRDLTIRSFGILSARDMPWVDVTVHPSDGWPVNASDAVLAATAAAAWLADGTPEKWPTRRAGQSTEQHTSMEVRR